MTDWTSTYLAKMPPRLWGDLGGDCTRVSVLYCMELRAMLQSQPIVLLSELDLLYTTNQAKVPPRTGRNAASGAYGIDCVLQAVKGVARDSLWSANQRTYDYDKEIALINTPPPAAAVADRVNQKLVTYERVYASSQSDFISRSKAYIDAGYPTLVYAPTNHMICGFRYSDSTIGGFDNRMMTAPATLDVDWSYAYSTGYGEIIAIKQVSFTGVPDPQPHPPNVALVQPSPPTPSASMNANLSLKTPPPAQLTVGQPFTAVFTVVNVGNQTLPSGGLNPVRLGSQDPRDNGIWSASPNPVNAHGNRIALQQDIPAGASIDVTGSFTAPSTPGNYSFSWQPVQEGVTWFGQLLSLQLAVVGGVQPSPGPTSWTGTFSASVDATGKLTGTFTSS